MAGGIRPAAEIRASTVIIIIAAGRPVPPPWRVLRVLMGDLGGGGGGGSDGTETEARPIEGRRLRSGSSEVCDPVGWLVQ